MKTITLKRVLSLLLAACLLLGLALSASAADKKSFGAQITVSKKPADTTFIPGITGPDLAGLELRFKLGGIDEILSYDDMWAWDWLEDELAKEPDLYYEIGLSYPEEELKLGANKFLLYVSVWTDEEYFSKGEIPITFTGISLSEKVNLADVPALTAGLPNKVEPSSAYGDDLNLYSFTPKVNGTYNFSSLLNPYRLPSFGELGNPFVALWDALVYFFQDPAFYSFFWIFTDPLDALRNLFLSGSDPIAKLVDADGNMVAEGDDRTTLLGGYNLNFNFSAKLEAGKTYYLLARSYGFADSPYLVTPIIAGL